MKAERQIQDALNQSEIEDSFFKSKELNKSAFSASQETFNQRKGAQGHSNTHQRDYENNHSNFDSDMMTPETHRARVESMIVKSDMPQYDYEPYRK